MTYNLNERIDVVSAFVGGKVKLIRFRWKQTTFKVETINGRWAKREGPYPVYNFSVTVNGNDIYEISFNARTLTWKLNAIYLS